jgi:prepilin-type N-terminal cleavage/methylation domain-containing protein
VSRLLRSFRRSRPGSDDGFVLLESIIAMAVIAIVMAGLATVLVTARSSTDRQRSAQTAARLAVSALDHARSIGAAGVVSGRDYDSARDQWTHSPEVVAPWLKTMTLAYNSAASSGSGTGATIPTVAQDHKLNGTTFSINYFVGYCWRSNADDGECSTSHPSDGTPGPGGTVRYLRYVRVVVAVTWAGGQCSPQVCSYISASLLDEPPPCVLYSNVTSVRQQPGAPYLGGDMYGLDPSLTGCSTEWSSFKISVPTYTQYGGLNADGSYRAFPTVPGIVGCSSRDKSTFSVSNSCTNQNGKLWLYNAGASVTYRVTVEATDTQGTTYSYAFGWSFKPGTVPPLPPGCGS